jgi:single-stranded-DNA-specific exonuclease
LLWQRGIRDRESLLHFATADLDASTPAAAFGPELAQAIARLVAARDRGERVAIWGDFDADGITATAVLWDGLGQFFPQGDRLTYHIPNRLTQSHGLWREDLARLAAEGCRLIVTCDTGSTHAEEIAWAQTQHMDVIVTDHHTLPSDRPPAVAVINPRSLPADHPFAHLSGVAVAYKLVEALYQALPEVPTAPLDALLDLVAIGLIADLVALRGEGRILARAGLRYLASTPRPGLQQLLQRCKRAGDRPSDIAFGLGPRINAASRIYGDASFCIDLLTARDPARSRPLAERAELANSRRKALQRDLAEQVNQRIAAEIDLSTTWVIVLAEPLWPVGVLGLVAGQVAQTYGRPVVLLSIDSGLESQTAAMEAKGSARSVAGIDLYDVLQGQASLLTRFGGHPYAAGLALPVANITLLAAALNSAFRERLDWQGPEAIAPTLTADLAVSVADLGYELFQELKLLEPYGMGNPIPRLLIRNCWFDRVGHKNLQDASHRKVRFIRTHFQVWDDTVVGRSHGFPGTWWGHYQDEVPQGRCDLIAELDFNARDRAYELRAIAIRPATSKVSCRATPLTILDQRQLFPSQPAIESAIEPESKSGAKSAIGSERKSGIESERKSGAKSAIEPERKSGAKSAIGSERKSGAKSAIGSEHKSGIESERKLGIESERKSGAKSAIGSEHKFGSKSEMGLGIQPGLDGQDTNPITVTQAPHSWAEWQTWLRQARASDRPLLLAYRLTPTLPPADTWAKLVGIAKYLSRTQTAIARSRLQERLDLPESPCEAGLEALRSLGFTVQTLNPTEANAQSDPHLCLTWHPRPAAAPTPDLMGLGPELARALGLLPEQASDLTKELHHHPPVLKADTPTPHSEPLRHFLTTVRELRFQQHYWASLPVAALHQLESGLALR